MNKTNINDRKYDEDKKEAGDEEKLTYIEMKKKKRKKDYQTLKLLKI